MSRAFDDDHVEVPLTSLFPAQAIRVAATTNLKLLALKFGPDWAKDVALPRVADLARQRYYLRRITALKALGALSDVLSPDDVATDVLDTVLDLADDAVPNVRFNAATALKALGNKIRGDPARKRLLLKKLADLADNDADADVIAISKAALAEVTA